MKTERRIVLAALGGALCCAAPAALAAQGAMVPPVWPELAAERAFISPIPILVAALVEVFLIEFGLKVSQKQAFIISAAMNAASTAGALLVYPLVAWGVKATGLFNPFSAVGLFLAAILASTVVELAVVRRFFHVGEGQRGVGILLFANILSTVIFFYYMLQYLFPK